MFLAICLLVVAGLTVIGTLVTIATGAKSAAITALINAFCAVIEVLAAIALMKL